MIMSLSPSLSSSPTTFSFPYSIPTIGFPGGSVVKNPPVNATDMGLNLRLGRSPGAGNGELRQYSCLENSMDRGA